MVNFDCSAEERDEARKKYFLSKGEDGADSRQIVKIKNKQKLITAAYGSTEQKFSDAQVNTVWYKAF